MKNAKALAERFITIPELSKGLKISTKYDYKSSTTPIIRFSSDGSFSLDGVIDLAGRAVISKLAKPSEAGNYELDAEAIAQGGFSNAVYEVLKECTHGGLPDYIEATISIWRNKSNAPAIAKVNLFQHPHAVALSKYPNVSKNLAQQLGESSFLIKQGCEKDLELALKSIGINTSQQIDYELKTKAVQKSHLQTGLATRKMREMIESAIAQGRSLELHYYDEKVSYNRYGSLEKIKR